MFEYSQRLKELNLRDEKKIRELEELQMEFRKLGEKVDKFLAEVELYKNKNVYEVWDWPQLEVN